MGGSRQLTQKNLSSEKGGIASTGQKGKGDVIEHRDRRVKKKRKGENGEV